MHFRSGEAMENHPEVWLLLGQALHDQFFASYPDFWSGFQVFIGTLSQTQRAELLSYLTHLEASTATDAELAEVWIESGTQFWVPNDEIRDWLSAMRTHLEMADR